MKLIFYNRSLVDEKSIDYAASATTEMLRTSFDIPEQHEEMYAMK